MNTRYLLVFASLVCLTSVAACGGSEPVSTNQQPLQSQPGQESEAPAPSAMPVEQFVAGQLKTIDLEARTLILEDLSGNEQEFAFSQSTEVTGISSAEELVRQEGRQATIRFVELDDLKSAVQIHVEVGS